MGDIIIAEPNAFIQFAGEVITRSSVGGEKLKTLWRVTRSELYLEHRFVDMVVPRNEMKPTLTKLLSLLCKN